MKLRKKARKRLRAHAKKFDGLPTVTVPSAAVTDEQINSWSAEMYARDLGGDAWWLTLLRKVTP